MLQFSGCILRSAGSGKYHCRGPIFLQSYRLWQNVGYKQCFHNQATQQPLKICSSLLPIPFPEVRQSTRWLETLGTGLFPSKELQSENKFFFRGANAFTLVCSRQIFMLSTCGYRTLYLFYGIFWVVKQVKLPAIHLQILQPRRPVLNFFRTELSLFVNVSNIPWIIPREHPSNSFILVHSQVTSKCFLNVAYFHTQYFSRKRIQTIGLFLFVRMLPVN